MDVVRSWLLWLGVVLLALSALTFTIVAWARLGANGRAGLLGAATVVAGGLAVGLRRRLPATAEALTALALALALVDWQALRVAGVAPGISDAAWWCAGTAIVGASALLLGRVTSRSVARVVAALLLPLSVFLAVVVAAGGAWSLALGLSVLAAALVPMAAALEERVDDHLTARLLRAEAAAIWSIAVVAALVAVEVTTGVADAATPAAVLLSCGLAPALATVTSSRSRPEKSAVGTAALATAAPMGAVLVLTANVVGARGSTTLAVVLAAAVLVSGPWLRGPWGAGALVAGAVAAVPGVGLALTEAAIAVVGPLAWLGDAWTGDLDRIARDVVEGPQATPDLSTGWTSVGSLAASAIALAALALTPDARRARLGTAELAAAAGVLGVGACCLAPVAGGGTVAVALVATAATMTVMIAATLVVERHRRRWTAVTAVLAILSALPAAGWAATTPGASVSALALLAVVAGAAACLATTPEVRATYAGVAGLTTIALVGVALAAEGGDPGTIGFSMAVSAGAVLLGGVFARRGHRDGVALELAGGAGMVAGVAIASDSSAWLAGALTATVPMLALGVLRHERRVVNGFASLLAAIGATWAWLAVADVRVVEAYTLPAAVVALAAGAIAWRASRVSSWWAFGPASVVALGPTLMLTLADDDVGRALAVGAGAVAIVVVGAARRLQAPLVIGSAVLMVLAVDTLGPAAARLPRWLLLAVAGALLLYIGATFERRRDNLRRARGRFSNYA